MCACIASALSAVPFGFTCGHVTRHSLSRIPCTPRDRDPIGLRLDVRAGSVRVTAITPGGLACRAQQQLGKTAVDAAPPAVGDEILAVNGVPVAGLKIFDVSALFARARSQPDCGRCDCIRRL